MLLLPQEHLLHKQTGNRKLFKTCFYPDQIEVQILFLSNLFKTRHVPEMVRRHLSDKSTAKMSIKFLQRFLNIDSKFKGRALKIDAKT